MKTYEFYWGRKQDDRFYMDIDADRETVENLVLETKKE